MGLELVDFFLKTPKYGVRHPHKRSPSKEQKSQKKHFFFI
jgi:hypothetical protein